MLAHKTVLQGRRVAAIRRENKPKKGGRLDISTKYYHLSQRDDDPPS